MQYLRSSSDNLFSAGVGPGRAREHLARTDSEVGQLVAGLVLLTGALGPVAQKHENSVVQWEDHLGPLESGVRKCGENWAEKRVCLAGVSYPDSLALCFVR